MVEYEPEKKTLLDRAEISILEAEKRANPVLKMREFFTTYLIETRFKEENEGTQTFLPLNHVWRRYSEFEQFQQYLQEQYSYIIIPPLPEKRPMYAWRNSGKMINDITDPEFVDRRRVGLENFLHRVAAHPTLCFDGLFQNFLCKAEGWNESLRHEGYMKLLETKLKEITALQKSPGTEPQDCQFKKISIYAKNFDCVLDEILRSQTKVAELTYIINTTHKHLGTLFSEWSVIEKTMGDGLQKVGHYADKIAENVEPILQEEDVIADQLKEYLFYATSVENVCKHRIRLQLQIENLKSTVTAKTKERERVEEGKVPLLSRLFGAVQTAELKSDKIRSLNAHIEHEKQKITDCEEALLEFEDLAMLDFRKFQKQKNIDIIDTLSNFVQLQIRAARNGLKTWTSIKNAIETVP